MRAITLADLADQIVAWARAAQQTPLSTPSER